MKRCAYCKKRRKPAATDRLGRVICAVCSMAALRVIPDVFGQFPRKEVTDARH